MATSTTNYGLRKPSVNDIVNVSADIGSNMDTIDTTIKSFDTRLDTLEGSTAANDVYVRKTADTTYSTSSFVDDPHLTYSIPSTGTYYFEFNLGYSIGAGEYLTMTLVFPTGTCAYHLSNTSNDASVYDAHNNATSGVSEIAPRSIALGNGFTYIRGILIATATGTFKLQAKEPSSGTVSILQESFLVIRKVVA